MKWPLGIFARGRRDWSIESVMWGAGVETSTNAGGPQVNLNNNDAAGRRLAVYALIPWTGSNPPLVSVQPVTRSEDGYAPNLYPLHFGNPVSSGHVSRSIV